MSPAALNVCQELQSCLEPKLIQQNDNGSNTPFESRASKTCAPIGSWNLLDYLAKSRARISEDLDQVYLHPLNRRSMYSLIEKILKMCTENLGSEMGCIIYSSIDELITYRRRNNKTSFLKTKYSKTREFPKKMEHGICFPPPLSSINGRDVVRMHSHREGGRLVIKAFSFSSGGAYFRAIREDGRLRLYLPMNKSRDWTLRYLGTTEKKQKKKMATTPKIVVVIKGTMESGVAAASAAAEAGAMKVGRGWLVCHVMWPFLEHIFIWRE